MSAVRSRSADVPPFELDRYTRWSGSGTHTEASMLDYHPDDNCCLRCIRSRPCCFWTALACSILLCFIIIFVGSISGKQTGYALWMSVKSIDLCIELSQKVCSLPFDTSNEELFRDEPAFENGNHLQRTIWEAMKEQRVMPAVISPEAYYVMCMNKIRSSLGYDQFTSRDEVMSPILQDIQQNDHESLHESTREKFDALGVKVLAFDPSAKHFPSELYQRLYDELNPWKHTARIQCPREGLPPETIWAGEKARRFMELYRDFLVSQNVEPHEGFGVRLSKRRCDWVPALCATGQTTQSTIIDLAADREGWRAKGSSLEQPPWNHWPDVLTDDLLSDVMFSIYAIMVQSISSDGETGWEVKLTERSKACAKSRGAVYVVPTAWMTKAEVRPHHWKYGVDMFFDKKRRLVGMYRPKPLKTPDGARANGCYSVVTADSPYTPRTWERLKLLGMASVLVLQVFTFAAAEKFMIGTVMWSAIYGLPIGHPIRNIMLPFGHSSLRKARSMFSALYIQDGKEFFSDLTALSQRGWDFVFRRSMQLAKRFSHPTGTPHWFEKRGLKDAGMPLATFGAEIRLLQYEFIKEALNVWDYFSDMTFDKDLRHMRKYIVKGLGLMSDTVIFDQEEPDSLAWFLSELLYRMSVLHTNMHHNPVCHSTLPNGQVFPLCLVKAGNRRTYTTSHHLTSMMIADMDTEPMPRLDYDFVQKQVFDFIGGVNSELRSEKMGAAMVKFQEQLLDIEDRVHIYNRGRCLGGEYEKSVGCKPYSCILPRELLISWSI